MSDKEITKVNDNVYVGKHAIYNMHTEASKAFSEISSSMKPTLIEPNKTDDPKDLSIGHQKWFTESNNFPAEYKEKVQKSSVPLRMFEDKVRLHYGGGLYYFTTEIKDGKPVKMHAINTEVENFMKRNKIQLQYANVIVRDYVWWKMSPVEVVIDRTNKKVVKVKAHDAMMVRWGDKNEKGVIDKAFLSAYWPYPSKDQWKTIDVIDPMDPEGSIGAVKKSVTNFIYPIMELTPGNMYYPLPPWATTNSMNWLEVSLYVPIYQKALLKNIVTLRYMIYIHDSFWGQHYPDWEAKPELKKKRMEDTVKSIEDTLAGAEKAGKFIVSGYMFDDANNEIKSIKVDPIEDKINDKAFLMSDSMGVSQLAYAWGYDPSVMGHGIPGGKELSGSGSEKMRSLQNLQIMLACDRVDTLDLMEFISLYHGWNYSWGYTDVVPTTLDQNKDGVKKNENDV